MAKRTSLHGAGRAAIAAAAGQKPGPKEEPFRAPRRRDRAQKQARTEVEDATPDRRAHEPPTVARQEREASAARSQAPALKGPAALYCEILGFGRARVSQALEAGQMLRACRTPAEAFETQAKFARQATEQYLRESWRVVEMAAQAIGETWAAVQGFGLKHSDRRAAGVPD